MNPEQIEPNASCAGSDATGSAVAPSRAGDLRVRAEQRCREEEATVPAALSLEDALRNLHDLQVAKVELEMQNEELIRAQSELEETEARYFDLFELAPVGYITLGGDGVILEANLAAATMLGSTKGALVGKQLAGFIAAEDQGLFRTHSRMVSEQGPQQCEVRLAAVKGSGASCVNLLCAPSPNGGCRVTLSDCTELRRHRDQLDALVRERTKELESRNARLEVEVAERNRAEEALLLGEKRYRAVVEDQTELIIRYRPDGSYTFVNQAFCRFFGKTQDEVVGRSWLPEVFADDIPTIEKRLAFLSPAHPVVVLENRVISGAGELRWMQFVNRGFFDGRGRLEETQAVGRDITEHKHAEEMLLAYADEVEDLYDHAPCGYHSLDERGGFVRINDTELSWLGYQRHEIVGIKHFSELVTDEGAELFRANFPIFLETGRVNDLEFEMVRKDGSRFPVVLDALAQRDADGRYLMSRSTVFDNTERKKAEEGRRRSEEKYRGLFENAPFGIFQSTVDGRILSANPAFAKMFGYQSPQQMIGDSRDGVSPYYLDPGQRDGMVQRALSREDYLQGEVEYRRRDDSHFTANFNLRAVQAGDGTFLEGFLEDITSRREAERALQKSELQFRQMAETIGEVFWLTSPATHALLYISPAYERIWGRPCAELYADPRLRMEAILPEDLPQVRRDLGELGAGRAVQMEYRIRRPDGTLRWISDRGYPLHDDSGAVAFMTGVASDITERKLAEETLKKYARRLIVLEEDLRKRIAMELHDDIGQVLTALGLNLAHIGNRLQEKVGSDLVSTLTDSRMLTKEISRTVRNLMVELRPTQLEEYGLAAAIRSHAEQYAQRTGIAVSVQADPRFPRLSAKKEIALFRVTQEALNNVLKHAAASRVTVSLRDDGAAVRLIITDDGRGFAHREAAPRPDGSGWGLTIMRERAALTGGSFRVDSLPGQGTTVSVDFKGRG